MKNPIRNITAREWNIAKKHFWMRTLKFTEVVIVWITALYIVNWVTSVLLITWAIHQTQNFAYLDSLIVETSDTFRTIVGVAIIKFGVENVFKYNDFGGKIPNNSNYDSGNTENSEDNVEGQG